MVNSQQAFWTQYIANMQIDLLIAQYTKVPSSWRDIDFVPHYNKLYYIIDGEGFLQVDDQTYYPQPGELYLLPAEHLQSYGTTGENTFEKYWCHFTAMVGNFQVLQLVRMPICLKIEDHKQIQNLFLQLINHHRSNLLTSGMRIHAILLELLALFMEQSRPAGVYTGVAASMEKMDHVLKYIEQHLSAHLSVEELAGIAHFHPNYFIRVFKETTGFSPIQYLNRRRLDQAKQMLAFGGASISEIAAAVGMELAYFSRMFKEHNGFAPSEYRELMASAQ